MCLGRKLRWDKCGSLEGTFPRALSGPGKLSLMWDIAACRSSEIAKRGCQPQVTGPWTSEGVSVPERGSTEDRCQPLS